MKKTAILFLGLLSIIACKKDPEPAPVVVVTDLNKTILEDLSNQVVHSVYTDLSIKTTTLNEEIITLNSERTQTQLDMCKQAWRDARSSWEKSEAFLFGPVSTENIDPRIDTWPVNFIDLEGQLSGGETFTGTYIDGLQDALKGFHPVEYLLFGLDGDKTANEITDREMEYLIAMSENLHSLITTLPSAWNTSTNGSFGHQVITAGSGSSIYPSRVEAFDEIVNAMAGICDEVANGKIGEPFLMQDPSLEESPFSGNSLIDFTNNIKGVEAVYLSRFTTDGIGLEDLVRKHNLSLDGEIKLKISNAITALNNITVPFGDALTSQPVQVQNAIDAINALGEVLENDLLNFVAVHGNE